ncbi:hypothetical protein JCM19241_589 [Vibrio ishigakensis]|uniref:Uncharacterized protein n=1 Tax=Vibrio ishigakensis TaxID=1481914 RepID=A0A0B8QCA2_9VIBR|nr:hypothetical protein JCM19241_589 [Vibrio ishigakensis]
MELEPNAKVRADDDVESLEWVPLAEITTEQFAFDSTKRAISEAKRSAFGLISIRECVII